MSDRIPVRRALISVFDKTGLPELAQSLHAAGVQIVSTGSTASVIAEAGVPVTAVEEVTEFPECLDGRVKTLHPRIHAGILADRRLDSHRRQLEELQVTPIDLVVANLYPFADTVASGAGQEECIEKIDIGGPSMVRAAAKNHHSVAVVVDPARYGEVAEAVAGGGFTQDQRRRLATDAFRHTATYDVHVATWMGTQFEAAGADAAEAADDAALPAWAGATWRRAATLRYGENSHQQAALYTDAGGATGLAAAEQLHGKAMSYNNYVDTDAAWRAAHDQGEAPTVAIIKHANPCGIAVGTTIAEAHAKAHACDPVSAFGGVIAANTQVSVEMAEQVSGVFTEVIIAPGYADGALEVLQRKKNIRVLVLGDASPIAIETKQISGGMLMQQRDQIDAPGDDPATWTLAAGDAADEQTLADLAFAWRAVRATKSNAILLADDGAAVGIGMGQVNRVDSCKLAVQRANTLAEGAERARGSVAASDAFFPFADGLQVLLDAGVRAVVQPGGSIRDEESIEAAQAAGVTLYLTGTRHFFH